MSKREGGVGHVGQEDNAISCVRVYRGGSGSFPCPRIHDQGHPLVRRLVRQPSQYALGRNNTLSIGYLASAQAVPRGTSFAAVVPPLEVENEFGNQTAQRLHSSSNVTCRSSSGASSRCHVRHCP